MYLHVQKWTSVKLDLFYCLAHDRKSPERGNVANLFEQRSWFRESLFDKQHDFNGTSLEVNRIWQSFYLGRMLNRNLHKVVYKKLQKRRSFSILLSSPHSRYMFDVKKLFFIDALEVIPRETQDDPLRTAIDLPESR